MLVKQKRKNQICCALYDWMLRRRWSPYFDGQQPLPPWPPSGLRGEIWALEATFGLRRPQGGGMDRRTDGRTNRLMNGRIDGWMDRQMDWWTDRQTGIPPSGPLPCFLSTSTNINFFWRFFLKIFFEEFFLKIFFFKNFFEEFFLKNFFLKFFFQNNFF